MRVLSGPLLLRYADFKIVYSVRNTVDHLAGYLIATASWYWMYARHPLWNNRILADPRVYADHHLEPVDLWMI